jgi:hypothetical protein
VCKSSLKAWRDGTGVPLFEYVISRKWLGLTLDPVQRPGEMVSIDLIRGQPEPKITEKQDNLSQILHIAATTSLTKKITI